MKRWLIAAAIILAVGGVLLWKAGGSSQKSATIYRVGLVDRGAVRVVVSATGTVSAVTTVTVGSQVSGTLKAIYVDFNSPVKQGQVIARLDPTFLQAAVAENEASVERARASLRQAQLDSNRVADLTAKKLVAQADLDNAMTSVETARAGLQQAEAQLTRAQVNLQYSVITSPIDGIVISRNVDVGQTVAASLQAPTLFTIAQDLRRMQVETNIDEADIGRLKEGMEASFTVDSYPEETFSGTISQIRYAARTDQNVVTYPVILRVENPDLKLRPGMTANVTVVTDHRENALRVPASALRFRPSEQETNGKSGAKAAESTRRNGAEGTGAASHGWKQGGGEGKQGGRPKSTIWLKGTDGKPVAQLVSTGLNDGSFAELTEAEVHEGDSVIIGMSGTSAAGINVPPGMGGQMRR